MVPICNTCQHRATVPLIAGVTRLECRRYPPAPVMGFAETRPNWSCGEYSPEEAAKPARTTRPGPALTKRGTK
jgi:hypothetical protein